MEVGAGLVVYTNLQLIFKDSVHWYAVQLLKTFFGGDYA